MKILITILILTLSINLLAATNNSNWTTEELNDAEAQVIDQASQDELSEISACMIQNDETEIGNTPCINDVFGDVHN